MRAGLPTGIDIRDGLQVECISCAACVDACNTVMDKMDYPRGLIRYTTEHNLSGQRTRTLRPRLIGYALVLLLMIALLTAAFCMRTLLGLEVSKDRMLFRENAEGRIENVYSLKVMNKDQVDHTYVLQASGLPDLKLQAVGKSVFRRAKSSACRWSCPVRRKTVVAQQRGNLYPQGHRQRYPGRDPKPLPRPTYSLRAPPCPPRLLQPLVPASMAMDHYRHPDRLGDLEPVDGVHRRDPPGSAGHR